MRTSVDETDRRGRYTEYSLLPFGRSPWCLVQENERCLTTSILVTSAVSRSLVHELGFRPAVFFRMLLATVQCTQVDELIPPP